MKLKLVSFIRIEIDGRDRRVGLDCRMNQIHSHIKHQ